VVTPSGLNQWQLGGSRWRRGWLGERARETTCAVVVLGKNPISTGRARRRAVSMVYAHYGGCVLGLLLLAGWRAELECCELQKGRFLMSLSLIPM
jgi:hypothetical protein